MQKSKEAVYENPLSDEVEWKRPIKKVDQNLNGINDNFEAKLPKSSSSVILENYTMIVGNPYSWIDATGGTELLLLDDDYSAQSLPFTFDFYNESYSTIYVGANGYLSFTDTSPNDYTNDPIPSSDLDNTYLIAPFWDDVRTDYGGGNGTIYVQSFGTYWVVEWLDVEQFDGNLIGTFELILYDNGDIVFNYDYISYIDPDDGYTCGLNLGVDTSYYNEYSSFTASTNDFSLNFTHINNYAPQLSSESVIPTTGNQLTVFNFSTIYTDYDNNQPSSINVIINGTAFPMSQQNLSDTDYTDGCIFHYNTYLNPAPFNYTYYFNCSDSDFSNSTTLKSDLNVKRVNLYSPTLSNDQVIPNSGYYGITDFTFIVNYSDVDNNAPIFINVTINSTTYLLSKEYINDNNYTDGCKYNVTIKLNVPGNYNYTFYCYDGFTDSLGPFTDLNVIDPGLNAINITSPVNITYIEPHPGYYPASYGFENDKDGSNPAKWAIDETAGSVQVIPNFDNHEKVLELYDSSSGNYVGANNSFVNKVSGTVEFYAAISSSSDAFYVGLRDDSTNAVRIRFFNNQIRYLNSTAEYIAIDGFTINRFYHFRWEFDCITDTYNLSINGVIIGTNMKFLQDYDATTLNQFFTTTGNTPSDHSGYLDAIGYSWDDSYAIGDNLEKGILLNTTTMFTPNYSCYSLDGQNNKTIWNKVAVMAIPTDGFHTVQVFANTSAGIWFKSEIVNFTTNLINDNQPTLTQGTVIPKIGHQLTKFNFTVIYTDLDNNYPIYINVTINGTSYEMQKRDNSDDNYTDGCIYQYITYLAPDLFNYTYLFNTSDRDFAVSTALYNDLEVNLVNNFYPELQNAEVNPIIGFNITLFNYTVYYFDADNNLPLFVNITINGTGTFLMEKVDPSDFNATDGILYYYNTTLTWGFYQFQINCSDESYPNSTGWIIDPEVHLFYGIGIGKTLFEDDFETGGFGTKWTLVGGGSGGVNTDTSNSGIYSAYHCHNSGEIWSRIIDLRSYSRVNFSCWIQQGDTSIGSEQPEGGEDFFIEYYNDLGSWITLDQLLGFDPGATIYIREYSLPTDALHANFRIRFRQFQGSGSDYDYWHIDDVKIYSIDYSINLLLPSNDSSIFNGWNNFSWTSLEAYFGSVNYTLQISNTSDFSFVNIEKTKILETPVNTTVEIDVDLVADLYFWRVRANYGRFKGNWTEIYSFDLIINNFTPNLSSVEVIPLFGSQLTKFNFTVVYSDQDNNPPFYVNVTINNTSYSMIPVNSLDTDYTDGCLYQHLIYLAPSDFNYTYSFDCSDGKYANSSILYDNLNVTEINLIAPNLINPDLNPTIGDNSTLFIFTVWYYDIENNKLTYINITINNTGTFLMEKADSLDFNATDGILYYYNTTLPWGFYKFQINCSDGVFTNSTAWIIGPEVHPFYNDPNIPLSTPLNESLCFTSLFNFTWTSLELPCGAVVNYTLQISNSTDFSFIIIEKENIEELSGVSNLTQYIDYQSGLYYWRVCAIYEDYISNWSNYYMFNLTYNENSPSLLSGSVVPTTGDQLTRFNFTVVYIDPDNNYPYSINVTINGTSYEMVKVNFADNNYTDGCLYKHLIYLAPSDFNYTYSFECYDGKYANSTILYDNLEVTETNLIAPNLINPQLNPSIGDNSTLFNFTVWYYDIEYTQPSIINITINNTGTFLMEKADPLDFNATDGILYYYNTTLPWGYYKFQIKCSDGVFTNSTGWIIGPEVNPFDWLNISSQKIIMNEISANPDFIEMYNYGPDQDMTDWYIIVYDDNAIDIIYNFPKGFIFKSKYVVVLHEMVGIDTDTDLYTLVNILWYNRPIAAGLFDNTGANIDWVQTSTHTLPRPPDAEWTQDVSWTMSNNYAYRTSDIDNNLASDWTVAWGGSSPGSLNPGQTGIGPSYWSIDLLSPLNTSIFYKGWNNFSWTSLEPPFGPVNYTLQISNTSDFTFVNFEKTKILETPVNTTVEIDIDLVADLYFWRVRANYGLTKSNWSKTFTFTILEITLVDDDVDDDVDVDDDDVDVDDDTKLSHDILTLIFMIIILGVNVLGIITIIVLGKKGRLNKTINKEYTPRKKIFYDKRVERALLVLKSVLETQSEESSKPEEMKYGRMCKKCGNQVSLEDIFCGTCGAQLEEKSSPLKTD